MSNVTPAGATPDCGLSLSISHPGMGRAAQAEADRIAAHAELPMMTSVDTARAQLCAAVDHITSTRAASDAERMAAWQTLSSAFWHYQHTLWDEFKANGYFSRKWDEQRTFSLGVARKAKPKLSAPNDSLTLSDLGL